MIRDINYLELSNKKICSICFRKFNEFGNNAWPINSGFCCDDCNKIVVVARINFNSIK